METSSKPTRQQRSEAEIKSILSEHEQSNMSVKKFCELYQISEPTFYNRRNKYQPRIEKEDVFIPLKFSEPPSALFAEIQVPGKRLYRVYKLLNLIIRRRMKRRLPQRIKQPLFVPVTANHCWSMDF